MDTRQDVLKRIDALQAELFLSEADRRLETYNVRT